MIIKIIKIMIIKIMIKIMIIIMIIKIMIIKIMIVTMIMTIMMITMIMMKSNQLVHDQLMTIVAIQKKIKIMNMETIKIKKKIWK